MMTRVAPFVLALSLACGKTHADPDAGADDAQTQDEPATSTSAVQIIVEPSDDAAQMLAAVKAAQTSIHMTMYLLTSFDFIDALIAQKKVVEGVAELEKAYEIYPHPNVAYNVATAQVELQLLL